MGRRPSTIASARIRAPRAGQAACRAANADSTYAAAAGPHRRVSKTLPSAGPISPPPCRLALPDGPGGVARFPPWVGGGTYEGREPWRDRARRPHLARSIGTSGGPSNHVAEELLEPGPATDEGRSPRRLTTMGADWHGAIVERRERSSGRRGVGQGSPSLLGDHRHHRPAGCRHRRIHLPAVPRLSRRRRGGALGCES
jgi:hypothetical protein